MNHIWRLGYLPGSKRRVNGQQGVHETTARKPITTKEPRWRPVGGRENLGSPRHGKPLWSAGRMRAQRGKPSLWWMCRDSEHVWCVDTIYELNRSWISTPVLKQVCCGRCSTAANCETPKGNPNSFLWKASNFATAFQGPSDSPHTRMHRESPCQRHNPTEKWPTTHGVLLPVVQAIQIQRRATDLTISPWTHGRLADPAKMIATLLCTHLVSPGVTRET